jgi:hypothetical protein
VLGSILSQATLVAALSAPRIELYTMGQGAHVFERFGHAALCVVEGPGAGEGRCYNYGTTDFGSPPEELGWAFLKGTSRFWVSVWPRERMLRVYRASDRTIWRQILPLTAAEARAVAARLARDALPENREYTYHHFDDNCSTRLRDLLDDATGGVLQQGGEAPVAATYRQLAQDALAGVTPALIAGDLWVGRRADAMPTAYEAAFLPDVLRGQVEQHLGAVPEVVYERRGDPFPVRARATWRYFTALAMLLAAPVGAAQGAGIPERLGRLLVGITGAVLGAIGAVTWLVVAVTAVPELRWNEAALLFWPTDALLGALSPRARQGYARLRLAVALLVSSLVALGVFRQPLLAPALMVALPMALCRAPGRARSRPAAG